MPHGQRTAKEHSLEERSGAGDVDSMDTSRRLEEDGGGSIEQS